jgi:membrane associated rhomboid family serine protease
MKNYLALQLYKTLLYPFLFVLACWFVHGIAFLYDLNLTFLGVLPREVKGMPGIATSVFIHGDITHLASNSMPLLVLGAMLFYFYKKIAIPVFFWIWFVSGLWLWIGGRNNAQYPSYHIGASTLVYGFATFLFFSGVIRRHLRLMVVSALVVFLYGSIMWGIFPLKAGISWEGHLFGAIAGVMVAISYRKEGPQRRVYVWEEEEEDNSDEQLPPEDENSSEPPPADGTYRYIYRPNAPGGKFN